MATRTWEDQTVPDTFKVGEWVICHKSKYNFADTKHTHLVAHECEKSKAAHDEPWIWGAELQIPCPDCGERAPESVVTVFEMLKQ